jgi:drug/metabolite transporter (DMT)-like permease
MKTALKSKSNLAIIALLFASVIWGIATPILKLTLESIPPFTLAFLRFFIASLIMIPLFFYSSEWKKLDPNDFKKIVLAGVFGITLNIGFLFAGASLTSGIHISILLGTEAAFIILAAVFFLKEKLTKQIGIGVIISFVGTLIIIGQPLLDQSAITEGSLLGDFLIILAVVAWAIYTILSKEISKKYKPVIILPLIFLIGVITFFPFAVYEFIQNPLWIMSIKPVALFGILYYGLFCSIAAYFLYTWGLSYATATIAGIETYFIPLISIPASSIILKEKIDVYFVIGSLCILLGLFICEYKKFVLRKTIK